MAMNLGVKVFLVLMCLSFVFSIAPNDAAPNGYGYGTGWNLLVNTFSAPATGTSVFVWLATLLGIAGVVTLATTTLFPNAFTLFATITAAFTGFVVVPWDLVTSTNRFGFGSGSDVGAMIPGFFIVVMIFMVFIVLFSMFKGSDF